MNEQQEREVYLMEYITATDNDDKETISRLLKIAKTDDIFKQMIVQLHSELDETALFPPDEMRK